MTPGSQVHLVLYSKPCIYPGDFEFYVHDPTITIAFQFLFHFREPFSPRALSYSLTAVALVWHIIIWSQCPFLFAFSLNILTMIILCDISSTHPSILSLCHFLLNQFRLWSPKSLILLYFFLILLIKPDKLNHLFFSAFSQEISISTKSHIDGYYKFNLKRAVSMIWQFTTFL